MTLKSRNKILRPYRLHTGSLAWIIHRVTGILLFLYIFLHLYEISQLKDPERYKEIILTMNHPVIKLGELGLLGLVLTHGLNGLRLTLIDLGVSTRFHKIIFWSLACIGLIILTIGGLHIIGESK